MELNPDVEGEAINHNPEQILQFIPDFFKKFDLIIMNETSEVLKASENFVLKNYRRSLESLHNYAFNTISP